MRIPGLALDLLSQNFWGKAWGLHFKIFGASPSPTLGNMVTLDPTNQALP